MRLRSVFSSSLIALLPLTVSVPLSLKHSAKSGVRTHGHDHEKVHSHRGHSHKSSRDNSPRGKPLTRKHQDHSDSSSTADDVVEAGAKDRLNIQSTAQASNSLMAQINSDGRLDAMQHQSSISAVVEQANATLKSLQDLVVDSSMVYPSALPLNGNFETGDSGVIPQFWGSTQSNPGHLSTQQARSGSKSLKLVQSEELVSGWDADSCFTMENGNRYVLTFWAKSSSADSALLTQFLVFSRFSDSSFRRALRTKGKSFQMYHTVPVTSEWKQYSHEFTADEDSGKVRLIIGCTSGALWIDDMAFYQKCPDILSIAGAEDKQTKSMGAYSRQSKGKYGQPIYKNTNGMYLYFWGDYGSWLIGSDYKSENAFVQSPNAVSSGCPTSASGQSWSVMNKDGNWETQALTLQQVLNQ